MKQAVATFQASDDFPINDDINAWVPHGRFVMQGAGSGPLTGLTFAVKDLFDVAGYPTGAGNPTWLATHPVPTVSSPIVDSLLQAGATLVGKTISDELAYSINGDNVHYGTPINVRARDRVPGGSSSGSVAAVAARKCDFALGTDTGGSTRVPASYCGVWGLRTTHGLLPSSAMVALNPSFDTSTWFAHDPDTFMKVAKVLVPTGQPVTFSKVMMFDDAMAQADDCFREKAEAVFAALAESMESSHVTATPGGTAEELELWRQTYITASAREAWLEHGVWIEQHQPTFGPAIAGRFNVARDVGPEAVAEAIKRRGEIMAGVRNMVGKHGVAVLPSSASVAPLLTATGAEVDELRSRTFRITCIAGLSGLPQVSLPFEREDGLPFGISLLGPAGSDEALVALAVEVWRKLQA